MDPNPIPPMTVQPQPVASTPPAIQPLSTKPKNWLIISLVILVVLLSLGAAGFFAYQNVQLKNQVSQAKPTPTISPSPTPDPTANWKTYSNTKYNYQVKYPDELEASEDAKLAEQNYMKHLVFFWKYTSTPLKDRTMVNGRFLLYSISLGIPINKNNLSLDKWLLENSESLGKEERKQQLTEFYNGAPKSIIIDQSKGYQWKYQSNIITLFEKNGTIYQAQSTVIDPLNTNLEDVVQNYNQILSTFRFLDQTPTPTCRPRPACLDATPRCLMPESSDMCPPGPKPTAIK